jgi:hypothetical protein
VVHDVAFAKKVAVTLITHATPAEVMAAPGARHVLAAPIFFNHEIAPRAALHVLECRPHFDRQVVARCQVVIWLGTLGTKRFGTTRALGLAGALALPFDKLAAMGTVSTEWATDGVGLSSAHATVQLSSLNVTKSVNNQRTHNTTATIFGAFQFFVRLPIADRVCQVLCGTVYAKVMATKGMELPRYFGCRVGSDFEYAAHGNGVFRTQSRVANGTKAKAPAHTTPHRLDLQGRHVCTHVTSWCCDEAHFSKLLAVQGIEGVAGHVPHTHRVRQ